jgi:hypothetical protein
MSGEERVLMSEVVYVFDAPLIINGDAYEVQVCGRPAGTIWEGWIEFRGDDGEWLRSPRETTQPDRAALQYWATGLSVTYLEGALDRALSPQLVQRTVVATPHFTGPAERVVTEPESSTPQAILDPFAVGAKGETLLRQELGALRGWHLRNIVRAYELADPLIDLEALSEVELADLIVDAVQPA